MRGRSVALPLFASLLLGGCDSCRDSGPPPLSEGSAEGSSAGALMELEPNNESAQATRLLVGKLTKGTLDAAASDVDFFFAQSSESPATLTVTTTAPLMAELYVGEADKQGSVTGTRFLIPAGVPKVIGPFARTADAFLSLSAVSGKAEYEVTLAQAPAAGPCDLETSIDDDETVTELLGIPSRATRCLQSARDTDRFLLPIKQEAEPGYGLVITPVEGVQMGLTIYDPVSKAPLVRLAGDAQHPIRLPNLRHFTDPAVALVADLTATVGGSATAAYTLSAEPLPMAGAGLELEPNDTVEQASVVAAAAAFAPMTGYFSSSADVDYLRVESDEPAVLQVVAQPAEGMDLVLTLPPAQAGGAETVVDLGTSSVAERLCALPVSAATPVVVGVRLRGQPESLDGSYQVRFEPLSDPNYELEPNNTAKEAVALTPPPRKAGSKPAKKPPAPMPNEVLVYRANGLSGSTVVGHIATPADVDVYRVEIPEDPSADVTLASVTLRLDPGGPADYTLELFDGDGALVSQAASKGVSETEVIAVDLPNGNLYARVTLVTGDACAAPYRLTVSRSDFPPPPDPNQPLAPKPEGGEAPPTAPELPPSAPGGVPQPATVPSQANPSVPPASPPQQRGPAPLQPRLPTGRPTVTPGSPGTF